MKRTTPFYTLSKLFDGKHVAIVGNAPEATNRSEEIESCDVVVRINNFYDLKSGNVGSRTDVLFVTPCAAWNKLSSVERGGAHFARFRPIVSTIKTNSSVFSRELESIFGDRVFTTEIAAHSLSRFTTGTCLLASILDRANPREIVIAGFERDAKKFLEYLKKDGAHYLQDVENEIAMREFLFKKIDARGVVIRPRRDLRVIIPARKGSSLKNKNILPYSGVPLLELAVKKAVAVFGGCEVLTDSQDYLDLAVRAGARETALDRERDGREDVTDALERWRVRNDFCGDVLLFQCTSPNVSEKTLGRFRDAQRDGFRENEVLISCVEDKFKSTAYFGAVGELGDVLQLDTCAHPTAPRQSLSTLFRFTGALSLFNTRQLRGNRSFFSGAAVIALRVPAREALDIDDIDDFKK